ncbi:MAG: hypothetical protein ACK5NC_11765 [Vibrio sp.]
MTQFESILRVQGNALENLISQQATADQKMMADAQVKLREAIELAIQASKNTSEANDK